MKRLIFFLIFSAIGNIAIGQASNNHFLYGTVGMHSGPKEGIDFNVQYIYRGKYVLKLGAAQFHRVSDLKSYQFEDGVVFSPNRDKPYKNHIKQLKFTVGRSIALNRIESLRLNLNLGLSVNKINEPINIRQVEVEKHLSDNILYMAFSLFFFHFDASGTWTETVPKANRRVLWRTQVLLNPELEFSFFNWAGISVSPFYQASFMDKRYNYGGVSVNFLLGKVRAKSHW